MLFNRKRAKCLSSLRLVQVSTQLHMQRLHTAPTYSTPAPVRSSKAEVDSARNYCSGLLQYLDSSFFFLETSLINETSPENLTAPLTPF